MTLQYVLPVRTAGHFARFTPDSDFFSPHILYSTHCLFTFTLVVNPLLTTIVNHIFSSVLAEPQTGNMFAVHYRVIGSGRSVPGNLEMLIFTHRVSYYRVSLLASRP